MKTAIGGAASVSARLIQTSVSRYATETVVVSGARSNAPRIPAMASSKMASRLPRLDDDEDVGVEKDHIVPRDDQPDLKFVGKLLGSAAPPSAPRGRWREYRVYRTIGGNHVFSKVGRSYLDGERDKFEAQVHEAPEIVELINAIESPQLIPTPTSTFASLIDPTGGAPGWRASAIHFFGYDPLAKELYRKLGIESERTVL